MIGAAIAGVDVVTVGAALAAIAYVVDRVMDARGWSRSSKNLRRENEDLVRRNTELEETVERHESEIARMRAQIGELEKTNLASAIAEIRGHETSALLRHKENALRGEQQLAIGQQNLELLNGAISILADIRDTLKERTPQ